MHKSNMEWVDQDKSLEQGTSQWKAARRRRIGGSEIAVIMRISPYKTRYELWEEKTGRVEAEDISDKPHVRRGIDAEPIARRMLERRHQVTYMTPVLVHPHHEWAVASLDGICPDHTLEIKTMSLDKHMDVHDGIIPDYYETQVQWGLMISGKKRGLFASFRPEDGSLYEVWINEDRELQRRMLDAAIEFWNWVETDTEPDEDFEWNL